MRRDAELEGSVRPLLLMEYCSGGDLFELVINVMRTHQSCLYNYDLYLLKRIFRQVCLGVNSLHTKANHAHLDIKAENVLLDEDKNAKLCDLCWAHPLDVECERELGTVNYKAPEVLGLEICETFNPLKADIFSLGVLLFITSFGQFPWVYPTDVSKPGAKTDLFFTKHK